MLEPTTAMLCRQPAKRMTPRLLELPIDVGALHGYLAGTEENLRRSSALRALANGSISTRGSIGESTNPKCR